MELSGWPAWSHTGSCSFQPRWSTSTISSLLMPSRTIITGLISTALLQVSLFIGLGNSWSHALSAQRPSPEHLEVIRLAFELRLPVRPHHVIAGLLRLLGEDGHHLVRAAALMQG